MKRIYFSILVTALISLFLLSRFIDQIFDAQYDSSEHTDFVVETQLLKWIATQLDNQLADDLAAQVSYWSETLKINLALEQRSNLSLPAHLTQQLASERGLLIDSGDVVQIIRNLPQHPDLLLIYATQPVNSLIRDKDSSLEFWLTLLFYFCFCLVLLIWTFPLTRRLAKLNRLASDFGAGDLSQRIETSRFSYIEQLEKSFNRMASQIEELLAENKLLAGSISHDLRTPLSCLRFGVDAALETQKTDKKDYYLQRMDDDLSRMETMLEAFLDYASLERKRFELAKVNVAIAPLVQSTVNGCRLLAENKHIQVDLNIESNAKSVMLEIDPLWIGRAVTNLVSNAINYAETKILVSCRASAHYIEISIEDDGPGIPEAEVDQVFKAFVKLDKSRSQNNHFGLGLAIVARVVSWHNGRIEIGRSELGGAKLTIQLDVGQFS